MSNRGLRIPSRQGQSIEWPTLVLAGAIYMAWGGIVACHRDLPPWALVPVGAWLTAWHGSLQHETIHGHPTRSRRLNALIGGIPLSLWLPYECYRRDHVAHHRAEFVTDPVEDPESRYLAPGHGPVAAMRRAIARTQSTLPGWMLLGPISAFFLFTVGEWRRLRTHPARVVRDWWPHLLGVAVVLAWLRICQMPLGLYVATFVYPGAALSLLRSYAEHRAAEAPGRRVAIVERAGPFAWLFLHNNLHAAHHHVPGLVWYRLPAYYRDNREAILAENGRLLYRGYGDVVRRFAFRSHDTVLHPLLH